MMSGYYNQPEQTAGAEWYSAEGHRFLRTGDLARFDEAESRIEMHLQAQCDLTVRWPGGKRAFRAGERIHTESSYKYTLASMSALLRQAGFAQVQHWADAKDWFAVFWASV